MFVLKRMLIVAYDVAPLNLISSQRINYFANFFHDNGFEVTILTSKKYEIDGPITDLNSYEILKRKVKLIEVDYLKNSVIGHSSSSKRIVLKKIRNFVSTISGDLFDYRTKWAFEAIKLIKQNEISDNYDVVISSSFPVCVHLIGNYLKKNNPKIKWIADFRDLWSGNHLSNYTFFSRSLDKFIEKKILRRSDRITVVSEGSVDYQKNLHRKDILVVRNGYIPEEFQNIRKSSFFEDKKINKRLNIVYAGNIYSGRRDPSKLIEYIQENNLTDKVYINFFGRYMGNLDEIIKKYRCDNFVKFHGELPRKEILSIMKSADINLFLESGKKDAKCVIPGKLFELVALSKPILVIGPTSDFESFQLIKESGLMIELEEILENKIINLKVDKTLTRQYQCEKILNYIMGDKID